jgi:ribosomal protein L12E/L44/L45/RPP1/RPP2
MAITSLADFTATQKEEMVASLACLLVGSSAAGGEEGVTAEKLQAVADAAGCSLTGVTATLFAGVVAQSTQGVESYMPAPGGGGGGGGGSGSGGGGAAPVKEEEKEEEEEMDLGGGMDMFGGEEPGGGDY